MKRALAVVALGLTLVTCRDATAPQVGDLLALRSVQAALNGAAVATDRADYLPGDTVVVTGTGWQAGEEVLLVLVEEPTVHAPDTVRVAADSSGAIDSRAYLIDIHDLGRSFTLTATGLTSGLTAQTTFRDGHSVSSISPSSGPLAGGNTAVIYGSFPALVIVGWDCPWWWPGCLIPKFEPLTYRVGFGGPAATILAMNQAAITVVVPPGTYAGWTQSVVFACRPNWDCHAQYFGYTYVSPNRAPHSSLDGPDAASEGSPIVFNASGWDPDDDPLTYDWDYGDGTVAPNGGPNAPHTYADNGSFTATVTVRDDHGHASTASAEVTVHNIPPSVSAVAGATVLQGEAYSASGSFTDPGADVFTGSVNWGDGSTAPLALSGNNFSLSHTYASAGTFTATVSITDDDGGTGTTSAVVTVINSPPVAVAGGPYAGNEGSVIAFNASGSSDRDGDPLTFDWSFGDGTVAPNSGSTPAHAYADNGTFTATVTVRDDHGHATTASAIVTVANVAPSVSVIPGAEIMQGETYSTTGTFTDPGADAHAGSVVWGDGSSATLGLSGNSFSLSHTYATAGTFTVTVSITDDDAGAGTTSALVTVLSPAGGAQALGGVIQNLVSQGAIPANLATPFLSSTDAAAASLASGNITAARGQLGAFLNKVEAAVKTGKISAAVGAELVAFAERVLASMGG